MGSHAELVFAPRSGSPVEESGSRTLPRLVDPGAYVFVVGWVSVALYKPWWFGAVLAGKRLRLYRSVVSVGSILSKSGGFLQANRPQLMVPNQVGTRYPF